MYKEISKLLLYGDLGEDAIIVRLAEIMEKHDKGEISETDAVHGIYAQIKRLLDLATTFGFDVNLWHNYLTYLLITNENSFSLTCERKGIEEGGSVNILAKKDFEIFGRLFRYDFSEIERSLGIDCFSVITNYKSIHKRDCLYNKDASEKIRELSLLLAKAPDAQAIFDIVTEHYKTCGVGMFGLNRAFRIRSDGDGLEIYPIGNADRITLDDLVGYEIQKKQLVENTKAFSEGKKANNVLLYGDSGTGKSSSIKAVLNEYSASGLRMIEIYKHQFRELSAVIAHIKNRNYRFIIYIDDLSFEENETEYKFLKAVIEGGVETRPENILIYATSNRRHLIRETWSDRADMEHNGDVHRSDTMEEKLSLSSRFGIAINYSSPDRKEFLDIIRALAEREGLDIEEEKLFFEANKWELRHGGLSGRTARQFIDYLSGTEKRI